MSRPLWGTGRLLTRRAALTHGIIGAVLLGLALAIGSGSAAAQGDPAPPETTDDTTTVDVLVWQHVRDPLRIYVSARTEGVRWDDLGTPRLHLDESTSEAENYRSGIINLEGVDVRVSQHIRDPLRIHISARATGGDWDTVGTNRLLLDDGFSPGRSYRYGQISIDVPLDAVVDQPPVTVSPGGDEVPRLALLTFEFRNPPTERDGGDLISIEPPRAGSFAWIDDRTLLFQPDYPGWQRGQQYRVTVDGLAAGFADEFIHSFTVEGGLEVAYVIPGDGDTEVPKEAQILVQFNRSVAALTVLQEGPAPAVLEIDPPLEGQGEWLNTSLYRFIPTELQPSTEYSVRIRAGLTSAADGVLESDFTWSFSTIQPAITAFHPGDNTSFVEPDETVVVTFNQPMDRASVEAGLTLRPTRGEAVAGSFEWNEDATVASFTPAEPLALESAHVVTAAAGLRSANGGQMRAERTARFITVGLPKLLWTSPSDEETEAWWGSIHLKYNNPMDAESFEERVSISGIDAEDIAIDGYSWDPQRIYIRATLEPSTEYTVRIAEGVRDRGGRPLPAYEFSFTTRAPSPSLSLAVPATFSTLSAEGEQVLYYHAARLDSVRFRLYELSDAEAETLLRRGWIDSYRDHFWPESEPLRDWSEPIAEELRNTSRLYSTDLSDGEQLGTGHYLLVAEYEGIYRPRKVVLSVVDTAIVTKQAFDELLVWALDYDTGEPLESVGVRAALIEEAPLSAYQAAATDADGLAQFASTSSGRSYWNPYDNYLVRVDEEGREGVSATWWDAGTGRWDLEVPWSGYYPGWKGHLYTERPIYRPGETVHFKGVVRDENDARYSLPGAEATFRVTVRDSRHDNLPDIEVELTALGTLDGDIKLADDAPTGTYWVSVVDSDGRHVTSGNFTVAEFRVPEFRVEVETAKPDYVAGDAIATEARASFFFGGPVADSETEWTAYARPTVIRVEGYEDYSFSEHSYYWWARADTEWDPLRGRGETRTDAEGVARFEAPATLEEGEGTQEFTISATVTDVNAQAIADNTQVTVHPATWYAGIKPESYIGREGEPETIHLVTVDFERQIAPQRPVTVRIYEREWIRTKEQARDGGYRYTWEQQDTEIVDPQTVTTGENGEASIEFTPPSAGTYWLVAESTDDAGRIARSARYLWVSGSDYAPWPERENDVIELIADRDSYEVGDVAEVLVPAPFADATALVTIERGRVLSKEVQRFETNSEVLHITIEDAHIPNVFVGVVLYRPPTEDDPYPRYVVGYVELSISTAPRRLDVTIEADRDRAFPGETVQYEVRVTDDEGEGVAADVSVAVVDQAVLSLLNESGQDGMSAFWYERALGVRTASSLAVSVDRRNEAYDEVAEGERGEGSGQTSDLVGEPAAEEAMDDEDSASADSFESESAPRQAATGADDGAEGVDARIRKDFKSTADWRQITTDEEGRASFELTLPDNATTWRARARAVTAEPQVGQGESELLVTQPLLVRPALPRFLRVGDEVTLRTLVRNGTDQARDVTATIAVEGVVLDDEAARTALVEPGDSAVFTWSARAVEAGHGHRYLQRHRDRRLRRRRGAEHPRTPRRDARNDRYRRRRGGQRRHRVDLPAQLRDHRQRGAGALGAGLAGGRAGRGAAVLRALGVGVQHQDCQPHHRHRCGAARERQRPHGRAGSPAPQRHRHADPLPDVRRRLELVPLLLPDRPVGDGLGLDRPRRGKGRRLRRPGPPVFPDDAPDHGLREPGDGLRATGQRQLARVPAVRPDQRGERWGRGEPARPRAGGLDPLPPRRAPNAAHELGSRLPGARAARQRPRRRSRVGANAAQ